ncbi:MAG: class I SAM-dependent methyltransferase [Thermodesulfobacteriota bacterium]
MEWIVDFFTEEFKQVGFNAKSCEKTKTEVDFMVEALELTGAERILDLCCGVGRHFIEFAKRGFQVVGLDCTSLYLDIASTASTIIL